MYIPSGKNDGKNNNRPDLLSNYDISEFPDAERLQPDILCGDKCACRPGNGLDGYGLAAQFGAVCAVASDETSVLGWDQPFPERTAASDITVSAVACFTTLYFITDHPEIVYPLCVAAVFSSLGCVYLVAYISKTTQDMYNMQKLEMQQKYYEDKLKDEERVRAIYHDMKNHLLVLEGSQGTEVTRRMAQELRAQIADYEDYIHTGNDFLDIIIRDKAEKAREKHIDFSAAIDIGGVDFIDPLDISTLFGNSIDNAIEASEKLPENQRVIAVKAGRVNDFISILIENNCVEKQAADKAGKHRTTKADSFLHGFGIANMEKTAEKYGGTCTTRQEDGKFTLKILIPVIKKS